VEAAVDRSDASALADLQMHWDEAYTIGLDGDIWSARFHGSADELRAHTSTELRELIRADYAYRQQVRRARAAADRAEAAGAGPDENDGGPGGGEGGLGGEDSRLGAADLDDDDLDDDDYRVHFDSAHFDSASADPPTGRYANIRGERMSI
jgi:hypothetical protein